MTRSRLPGLVPSRSASHSWNDGWVHADRSPVGSAFRTSSAGTSAATTRWAVKSTMASAGPPGDGMTSTKPSGGGWSPCAAACSITARGCSVTLGRLGLQQLVGGGVGVELSCRDLRHQSIEPLAAAPLLGVRPEPLVHDGPQLLAQARVAPTLEPAVGLEGSAMVEHRTPQVAEDRATTEGAARVDREHTDLLARPTDETDELVGERRLARTGRAGHPDRVRATRTQVQAADGLGGGIAARLDQRDELGDGGTVAATGGVDERGRIVERCYSEITSVIPGTRSMMIRSTPALRVIIDTGHVPHAPTSVTWTALSASMPLKMMSPPSLWSAGRMASMASRTPASRSSVSVSVGMCSPLGGSDPAPGSN